VSRPPSRIRRAGPGTGLRRVPVPGATVERRVQPGAVAGVPRWCLRSGRPSATVFHVQARLGRPKCFDGSLPACPGLRTPADRHTLANSVARMLPAGAFKPAASAMAMAKLSQHFRGRGHPYGRQDARSTLRPSCSSCVRPRLRHGRKTRYGWVASPSPTRTFTWQETPSFLGAKTPAVSRASSRSEERAEAVGVGSTALILIEAPSPADHRGMLRVGKTRLLTRRRPQCDFTPHSTHFTAASTCTPV
jgi:hypothetical protein